MTVLHERFPFVECTTATDADILRCHTPSACSSRSARPAAGSTATRSAPRRRYEAALLSAGAAIDAVRLEGLRDLATAGPPRRARPRDGLLPLRQRRDRRALGAGGARARSRRDRRLGRPPRQRHAGHRRPTTRRSSSRRCTSGRSTRARAATTSRARPCSTSRSRPGTGDAGVLRGVVARRARGAPLRAGPAARLRRLRRARRRSARRHGSDSARVRRPRAQSLARSRRASLRCSRAATTSRRCPTSSGAGARGGFEPLDAQTAGSLSRPSAAEGRRNQPVTPYMYRR